MSNRQIIRKEMDCKECLNILNVPHNIEHHMTGQLKIAIQRYKQEEDLEKKSRLRDIIIWTSGFEWINLDDIDIYLMS